MKTAPILNLTQHAATEEQRVAGVVEPANKSKVQELITFDALPSPEQIWTAADEVAKIAEYELSFSVFRRAMIGGAPFFMAPLERALLSRGIQPMYAFSKRESVDQPQADGSIRKTQIFRHAGFIEVEG